MNLPYSLYVHKRPLRTAFLVDRKTADLRVVTRIVSFCQEQWGGRFNPIILSDGSSISKEDWSLLKGVDPDVVMALFPLQRQLVQQIEDRLSPYLLEVANTASDDPVNAVPTVDHGLRIRPTLENLTEAFRAAGGSPAERVWFPLFRVTKKTNPLLDHFVQLNFGMYPDPHAVSAYVNRQRGNVTCFFYELEDEASLASHLVDLSQSPRWVYPIQLSASAGDLCEPTDEVHVKFSIVVGDSVDDIVLAWNYPIRLPTWQRQQLRSIWLPSSLALHPDVSAAMRSWLENMADPWQEGRATIQVISRSLEHEVLDGIAQSIATGDSRLRAVTKIITCPDELKFERDARYLRNRSELQLYRGLQSTEHFAVPGPSHVGEPVQTAKWMADMFIVFDGDTLTNESGSSLKLPPRNQLAQAMFGKPSRIKRTGVASVLMNSGDPDVKVRILAPEEVFRILLTVENTPCYTVDARSELATKPFHRVRRSDKGRYLSGVIELFGSLRNAHIYFEERFWRNVFGLMSQKDPSTDAALLTTIKNRLSKDLHKLGTDFTEREEATDWLAEYVLNLAREHAPSGSTFTYSRLVNVARAEVADHRHVAVELVSELDLDLEDLQEDLTELLGQNILLSGIRQMCQFCGTTSWYHINETQQTLRCPGCGQWNILPIQPDWHYKLNTLLQAAVARHGLVPVLLVLGELARWGSAFSYDTCLELLTEDGRPIGDLDVVALINGELVIGEIKQSITLFKPSDFSKMTDIARRLKPSRVIFSSLCERPTVNVQKHIAALQSTLEDEGIQVLWYQLPDWIFKPSKL